MTAKRTVRPAPRPADRLRRGKGDQIEVVETTRRQAAQSTDTGPSTATATSDTTRQPAKAPAKKGSK